MKKHSIISCASYGSSGSGVITDYLSEFNTIFNPGDFEFRFLQDYGGITTLEDCLVHSHHRLNSDIAIQNFIKYVEYQHGDIFNKRYEKYFNGKFKELSYKFLNQLIDIQWKGYWEEYQVLAHSRFISAIKYKILPRILKLLQGNKYYIARYIPRSTMYFANPSLEYFIQCVNAYFKDLCTVIDPQNQYKYLYFDQLLPPLNLERYFKYFDTLYVIVVDRDPRDYYIENCLKWREGWVPADIDKFIMHYKGIRKKITDEVPNNNILRLRFEDCIYKYDEFTQTINSFLGISENEHLRKKSRFNPAVSIKNTQLWKQIRIEPMYIHKIENELNDYCYEYK